MAAEIFIAFVLWWTMIAGFFLPVSVSSGMIDPENNAIDKVNLALVFLLAGIVCLLQFTSAKKYLHVFAGVVVLTSGLPAAFAFYSIQSMHTIDPARHTSLDISNKRNILVVSFDGLPGDIIGEVIRESTTFSDVLRDFTFFENVISQSPATVGSQIGELFGVVDFKAKGSDRKEVGHTLRSEGAVDALPFNQVEDSFALGYPGWDDPLLERKMPIFVQEQYETDTVDFFRYAIVRMWTRLPLELIEWERWMSPFRRLMGESNVIGSLAERMEEHSGPYWDKRFVLRIDQYRYFVSQLGVADKPLSARYLHYLFTHFPVDFDANCEYQSDDPEWYQANQQGF